MMKCWKFSLRVTEQDKDATNTTPTQHCTLGPSWWNMARKRKKIGIKRGKKLWLFTDNIIIYTEKPKQPANKLLDLNEVAWYKVSIQIWTVFLHTNKKQTEI